jgi:hypothetical protein
MKLWSINRVLRFFGLVLVIQVDDEGGPTELWIESARRYDARARRKW